MNLSIWNRDYSLKKRHITRNQTAWWKDSIGTQNDGANFVKELRRCFDDLSPIDGARHGEKRLFVFKSLKTTNQVFVRREEPKAML